MALDPDIIEMARLGLFSPEEMQELGAFNSAPAPEAMQQAQAGEFATQSGAHNVLAGIGKGLTDVAQGAGNMVGLVDDETINDRRRTDEELSGTVGGSVGEFVGEMAALAPLGAIAAPARILNQASNAIKMTTKTAPALRKAIHAVRNVSDKGLKLGKEYKKLTAAGKAAGEGALASAVLANPNERGSAALTGAGMGVGFNQAFRAGGRVFNRGLVKKSDEAKLLQSFVRKQLGKKADTRKTWQKPFMKDPNEVFIPVNMAKQTTGLSNLAAFPSNVAALTVAGGGMVGKQKNKIDDVIRRALGQQAFPGPKGSIPGGFGRSVDANSGDVAKAIAQAVRASTKGKGNAARFRPATGSQLTMARAARTTSNPKGQFSGGDYQRAYNSLVDEVAKETGRDNIQDLASKTKIIAGKSDIPAAFAKISKSPPSKTDIASRSAFFTGVGAASKAVAKGGVELAGAGIPSLAGSFLSLPTTQRALMGDAALQKVFREVMATPRAGRSIQLLGEAVRRTLSAQFAEKDIPPEVAGAVALEIANTMVDQAGGAVDYATAGGLPALKGRLKGDVINNLPAVKIAQALRG